MMEWWNTVERESYTRAYTYTCACTHKHVCMHTHVFTHTPFVIWELSCASEWDELPSDDEDKTVKDDETRYVLL